jgi:hypothetical protein
VLPAHLRDELDFTEEQDKQLDALEREVKEKLMKILTNEQKKKLRELGRRRPGGPPQGRPDRQGQRDGQRRPDGSYQRGRPPEAPDRPAAPPRGGRERPPAPPDRPAPPPPGDRDVDDEPDSLNV